MTRDTDERKMLPCPFCGGEAKLADWSATSSHGAFDIYCANLATRCVTMEGNNTEAEAIAAWNTRAHPAGHAEREALLRMERACEQLAATRSMAIYTAMIDGGQADALLELDNARKEARASLSNAPAPSEGVRYQDHVRLDWLEQRIVDTIYLDDGKIIDVAGNSVRAAIDAVIMQETPADTEDQGPDTLGERNS